MLHRRSLTLSFAALTFLNSTPVIAASEAGLTLKVSCAAVGATTGSIGTPTAVHFDPDNRLDVLVPVGDDLYYVTAPDPQQFSASLNLSGVTAYTTIDRPSSWIQEAVAATPQGLEFVRRDLLDEFRFRLARQTRGTTVWSGARALVTVDVDGDGDRDIVGLSQDGLALLTLERTAPDAWLEHAPRALSTELLSLLEVDWGIGSVAFVGVSRDATVPDDALVFVQTDGATFSMITPGGAIDEAIVLRQTAPGADSLAIRVGSNITVVRASGVFEAAVDLSHIAPSGMSSADVDKDGVGDLLVNSTVLDRSTVYYGTTSGAFDTATALLVSWEVPTVNMSVQSVPPLAADFDADGDVDVFQLFDDMRSARLKRSEATDETSFQAEILDTLWIFTSIMSSVRLDVSIPQLQSGAAPDMLEVQLTSSDFGADPGDVEIPRVLETIDTTGMNAGDIASFWLFFDGDMGPNASICVRALGENSATGVVNRTGVERAFLFERAGSSLRGTNNGASEAVGDENADIPVPPRPKEPIDPLG